MPAASAKDLMYGQNAARTFWSQPREKQIQQLTALDPSLKDEPAEAWNDVLTRARSKAEQRGVFAGVSGEQKQAPPTPPDSRQGVPRSDGTGKPPAPRGILHAIRRGAEASLSSVDQFGESAFGAVADIGRKFPGTVMGDPNQTASAHLQRWAREARERHQKYLDEDAKAGGGPQTTTEKVAEGVAGNVGNVALMAGTRSPAGMAAVEGVQHLNEGPRSAVTHAVEGYVSGKVLGAAGRAGEKALARIPGAAALPPVARRALTGAAVGALPGAASGDPDLAASGAMTGALAGGTQGKRQPAKESDNPLAGRYKAYRQLGTELDSLKEQHAAMQPGEERDAVRAEMEDRIQKLANLDESGPQGKEKPAAVSKPGQPPAASPPPVPGTKPVWPQKPVEKIHVEGSKPLFPPKPKTGQVEAVVRGAPLGKGQLEADIRGAAKWEPPPEARSKLWEPPPDAQVDRGKPAPDKPSEKEPAATPPDAPADMEGERLARYRQQAQEWAQRFGKQASEYQQSEEGQRRLAESLVEDLEKRPPPSENDTPGRSAVKRATRKAKPEIHEEPKASPIEPPTGKTEAAAPAPEEPAVPAGQEAAAATGEPAGTTAAVPAGGEGEAPHPQQLTEAAFTKNREGENPKWGEHVEMVPIEELDKYKEYDRRKQPRDGPEEYEELKGKIAKNGVTQPLILKYNPKTGKSWVAEGNHRLAISQDLGISKVPVRVKRSGLDDGDFQAAPREHPTGGHIPEDIAPSAIGFSGEGGAKAGGGSQTEGGAIHEPTRSTVDGIVQQAKKYGIGSIEISNGKNSVTVDLGGSTPEQVEHAAHALGESKMLTIKPIGEQTNGIKEWSRAVEAEAPATPPAEREPGVPEEGAETKTRGVVRGLPKGTALKFVGPSRAEKGLYVMKAPSGDTYLFSKEEMAELFGEK